MALAKSGFADAIAGTGSFKVDTDASGNIAVQGGATAAGSKRISINNIAAEAVASDIESVAGVFLNDLPGKTAIMDTNATTFTVKWEVE